MLSSRHADVWYLINNNLRYCLNRIGKYVEAEGYCRAAIDIDPGRYNAYKNLGISAQGQGRYREAADLLPRAARSNPHDHRTLDHLVALLQTQPELLAEHLEILSHLDAAAREVRRRQRQG